jgi:hypothetical protein
MEVKRGMLKRGEVDVLAIINFLYDSQYESLEDVPLHISVEAAMWTLRASREQMKKVIGLIEAERKLERGREVLRGSENWEEAI